MRNSTWSNGRKCEDQAQELQPSDVKPQDEYVWKISNSTAANFRNEAAAVIRKCIEFAASSTTKQNLLACGESRILNENNSGQLQPTVHPHITYIEN